MPRSLSERGSVLGAVGDSAGTHSACRALFQMVGLVVGARNVVWMFVSGAIAKSVV